MHSNPLDVSQLYCLLITYNILIILGVSYYKIIFVHIFFRQYQFIIMSQRLLQLALDKYIVRHNVDVIIYGHTHKIDIRHEEPMVINPGECCSWLTGRSTVVLLDCETLEAEVIDLEVED